MDLYGHPSWRPDSEQLTLLKIRTYTKIYKTHNSQEKNHKATIQYNIIKQQAQNSQIPKPFNLARIVLKPVASCPGTHSLQNWNITPPHLSDDLKGICKHWV